MLSVRRALRARPAPCVGIPTPRAAFRSFGTYVGLLRHNFGMKRRTYLPTYLPGALRPRDLPTYLLGAASGRETYLPTCP